MKKRGLFLVLLSALIILSSLFLSSCDKSDFEDNYFHHSWGEWSTEKNPTCTEEGLKRRKDVITDDEETMPIAALGHEMENIPAVSATCTSAGKKEYWHCTRCNNYFADNKGDTAIADLSSYGIIEALGHDYRFDCFVWNTNTPEDFTAQVKYICSHDNTHIEYHDAIVTSEVTTAPACTEIGVRTYTATYDGHSEEMTESIAALGHDYQFDCFVWNTNVPGAYTAKAKHICSRDDSHFDYPEATVTSEITTAPTCTETGVRTYTATYAGQSEEKTEIVDALGHDYGYLFDFSEDGKTAKIVFTCKRDASHTYEEEAEVTSSFKIDPTCLEMGTTTYRATYQGKSDTKDVKDIPALGHNLIDVEAKAPTCEAIGWYDYKYCSRCDYSTYSEIRAIGHDYQFDSFVWDTATPGAYTAKVKRICSHDSAHIDYVDATVTSVITTAPTCTETGVRTYTAIYAGQSEEKTEVVDALGHDYQFDSFVWDTANAGAYTAQAKYICSHDGEHIEYYTATVTSRITKAATCTATGIRTYTASYDGHTNRKRETIPAIGHDYQYDSFVWDTATAGAITAQVKYICSHDNNHIEYYDAVVTSEITTAPTCTETGVRTYTATYGGHSEEETEIVEAHGHDYRFDCFVWDVEVVGHFAAQAKLICNYDNSHIDFVDAIVTSEITTPHTCTETGVRTYTATYDGHSEEKTAIISSPGHDVSEVERVDGTCEEPGYIKYACSRCDYEYYIYFYPEHTYVETERVAATCVTEGHITYTCSVCGQSYQETIPSGDHEYEVEIVTEPTSETTGIRRYTCIHCSYTFDEIIPKRRVGTRRVLLVQNRLAWSENSNANLLNDLTDDDYIIGWDLVAAENFDTVDLDEYSVIYIAGNDQYSSTYNILQNYTDELEEFADNGGVVIYGACDHGWAGGNVFYTLPGGARKGGNYYSYYNYIKDGGHPIVTGELTDGTVLTNSILYCNYSSHVYFSNLPEDANVIFVDGNGQPTLVEYPYGAGRIILSGLTWEFAYVRNLVGSTSYAKCVYDDLIVYAVECSDPIVHAYAADHTVDPTCTERGYTVYICTECNKKHYDDYVPALGHDMTHTAAVPATCTNEGKKGYWYCSRCEKYYADANGMNVIDDINNFGIISALGHIDVNRDGYCDRCTVDLDPVKKPIELTIFDKQSEKGDTLARLTYAINGNAIDKDYLNIQLSTDADKDVVGVYDINYTWSGDAYYTLTLVYAGKYRVITAGMEFEYDSEGNGYILTAYYGNDSNVVICGDYSDGTNGLAPVIGIENSVFMYNDTIESVQIPDSVVFIGIGAFMECRNLQSVNVPDSVTYIGNSAFCGCPVLSLDFEVGGTWYCIKASDENAPTIWAGKDKDAEGVTEVALNDGNRADIFVETYAEYYWFK